MAKINTAVRLSPRKGAPRGQDDPAVEEDEVEAGSDEERTANLLNSGLGSAKKNDATTKGLFAGLGKLGGFLGIGGRTVIEETQQHTDDTDGDNLGQDLMVTSIMNEREGAAMDRILPEPISRARRIDSEHVKTVPGTLSYESRMTRTNLEKRKRPGRRDIYDIETTENTGLNVEDEAEAELPARKHLKYVNSPKAKKSLVSLKRGTATATSNRKTTGKGSLPSRKPEPRTDMNGVSGVDTPIIDEPTKPKGGRGRPRKNRVEAAVVLNSDIVPQSELSARDTEQRDVVEDASSDGEDGISDILLNPSPVKPPEITRYESTKPRPESSDPPLLNGNNEDGGSEDEDEDEPQEVEETEGEGEGNANKRGNRQREALPEPSDELIDPDLLEDMSVTIRHVGHRYFTKTDEWVLKHKEKLRSVPGKRMARRLRKLIKDYGALRDAKSNGKGDPTELSQISAEMVTVIKHESNNVMEKLGNPELGIPDLDENRTRNVLTDVYFILIPRFVEALKAGVEAHQDEGTVTTEALEEIISLLDLIHVLGERALMQPKICQPTAKKGNPHRVLQPTRSILPRVKTLRAKLKKEVIRREREKKTEAWNRGAAQREKARQEKEAKELAEKRRQKREIYRLQMEAMERKLEDPFWGPYLQDEIEREEAKARMREMERRGVEANGYHASTKSASRTPSSAAPEPEDDELGSHPFGDDSEPDPFHDDEPERVSVFGNNNNSTFRKPMPLSKEEKEFFVDTMRYDSRENRYEIAAKKLGRSMDEIFAFAKELQEAMDDAHEKGRLNEDKDEWTYDIWIEQH